MQYFKEGNVLYDANSETPLGKIGNYTISERLSKNDVRRHKSNGNEQFRMPSRIDDRNRAYNKIRDIIDGCRENGIPNTMPGIVESESYPDVSEKHDGDFNMYPSATKGDWHPDFLGICYGTEKLDKVFKKAEEHQKPVNNINDPRYQLESTITIITDKWDRSTFLKHEATIIECAAHNCSITVILITDYGWTEVFNLCVHDVANLINPTNPASTVSIPNSWNI